MAEHSPQVPDGVWSAWAVVRRSALAAWRRCALIGVVGSGALGLLACDGPHRRGQPAPERPHGKAVARPAVAADADAGAAPDAPPLRYDVYPDLGAAVLAVTRDHPRVIGLGELHVRTDRPAPSVSALSRFSSEVLPALGDRVSDVVVETWMVDPSCQKGVTATKKIETSMKRPETTKDEIGSLFGAARERSITAHVMTMRCDDLAKLADDQGVDAELLLSMVTRELDRITRSAVRYRDEHQEGRPFILVYGGALHNDLYPFESTRQWSYALDVDAATGGRFVELDVYAPELVEGDPLYVKEPWYPLVAKAGSRGVMLVERAPRSYLAILPRS
ncbi:MAG TPA: hypothetical protein VHE35_04350 [Kofleriaceae bacterium]|nr:hypothetical protein [Kofleriaceae bacterium]